MLAAVGEGLAAAGSARWTVIGCGCPGDSRTLHIITR